MKLRDIVARSSTENQANVEYLIEHAAGLLKLVVQTFPTYTLHDRQHSENVLTLMEKLLGPQLDRVSPLEAALLILSAYMHDLGMVYTADELAGIADEDEFQDFLTAHPAAYVEFREKGVTPNLREWYCRWRHADRIREHLDLIPDEKLRWHGFSLRDPLIVLCRSHNQDAAALRSGEFEDVPINDRCDLRFCAVLLRLADILDFDATRTPRGIYQHLGLASRDTPARTVSDDEWRKHLSSGGFSFPEPRTPNYLLGFTARPTSPAIEHAVRAFLDVIEEEIKQCRALLTFCPDWQDLGLPAGIERTKIRGEGYVYGEFRFDLDRQNVLELFMGKNLYQNPYAFLRELLQNGIDAVRLRTELGLPGEEPAVDVTYWEDEAGYLWIRFDDSGIGMDEDSVRRFFLKVGRSYYRSPEFRAELLRADRTGLDFTPISRFGIGVLSCFLAGDTVEMTTRRVLGDGTLAEPVRLSIGRSEEFFVLQKGDMKPAKMPSKKGPEHGYRRKPGTSIAVRVDPGRVEVQPIDIAAEIDSLLLASPVMVRVNATILRGSSVDPIAVPWLGEPQMPWTAIADSPDERSLCYLGPIEILVLPLDLTSASAAPQLQGQLVAVVPRVPVERGSSDWSDLLLGWPSDLINEIDPAVRAILGRCVVDYSCAVSLSLHWQVEQESEERRLRISVARRLDPEMVRAAIELVDEKCSQDDRDVVVTWLSTKETSEPKIQRTPWQRYWLFTLRERLLNTDDEWRLYVGSHTVKDEFTKLFSWGELTAWSHNGIIIPTPETSSGPRSAMSHNNRSPWILLGAIRFSDQLRPDLDVARDQILGTPFTVRSAVQLAVRRAVGRWESVLGAAVVHSLGSREVFASWGEPGTLKDILEDPLVVDRAWHAEPVLLTSFGPACVDEVRHHFQIHNDVELRLTEIRNSSYEASGESLPPIFNGVHDLLNRALIQTEFEVEALKPLAGDPNPRLRVTSATPPPVRPELLHYPPLFFVPYAGPVELLNRPDHPTNLCNPLATWLIDSTVWLIETLPAIFQQLLSLLIAESPPEEINAVLDRVARIHPDLEPPPNAYVREFKKNGERWTR
ncbi:HD domain-containing protein [Longispora urticae]